MYDLTPPTIAPEVQSPAAKPATAIVPPLAEDLPVTPVEALPLTATAIRQAIASWGDLKPSHRGSMLTAVNHAEAILGFNPALLGGEAPWSCAGLNRVLWARPPSAYGLSKDAHRNMVSNLRTILIRLGAHADSRHGRNHLSPAWQALYLSLPTAERRRGLTRFFRCLTLAGTTPETITPESIDDFDSWCRQEILHDNPAGMSRCSASNWEFAREKVPGWPQVQLQRTGMRDHYAIPWSAFPPSFIADLERFLANLAAGPVSGLRAGNPYAPLAAAAKLPPSETRARSPRSHRRALSPKTIKTRRWQIQMAATALVERGVPIEKSTSLAALVTPVENVASILEFHEARLRRKLKAEGKEIPDGFLKSSQLVGIAEILRQIGKFEARLSDEDMDTLNGYVAAVSPDQQQQMSGDNATRLKALLEESVFSKLLHLADHWIKEAENPKLKPRDAALLAMYAAALEVFLFLPLRRGNLVALKLDTHLRRQSPNALITEIAIPSHMVKNRAAISWPVEITSSRLLETYIRKYRPLLAKPGNKYLFPNALDGHRNENWFGTEFSERVEQAIGAEFNCHLVRHFAVVCYLRKHPGAYDVAAHILGHKNADTTRRHYCGLELDAAARHANATLAENRRATKILALGHFHKPMRRRGGGRAGGGAK